MSSKQAKRARQSINYVKVAKNPTPVTERSSMQAKPHATSGFKIDYGLTRKQRDELAARNMP